MSLPYLCAHFSAALHFTVRHDRNKAKNYPVTQLQKKLHVKCPSSSGWKRRSSCSPTAYLLTELPNIYSDGRGKVSARARWLVERLQNDPARSWSEETIGILLRVCVCFVFATLLYQNTCCCCWGHLGWFNTTWRVYVRCLGLGFKVKGFGRSWGGLGSGGKGDDYDQGKDGGYILPVKVLTKIEIQGWVCFSHIQMF